MDATNPIFIIGTGRCGTRSMFKLLAGSPDIEIHHEYECTHIQRTAALYAMGLANDAETLSAIDDVYAAAIHYSEARTWIDSSNKASWLIKPLRQRFPDARFVVMVRDGRKVVSSFFNKLAAEVYPDAAVAALAGWIRQPGTTPRPPPEKKYWWNIPQPGQAFADEFDNFDQFQRICYHWEQCNQSILEQTAGLPDDAWQLAKLEEITNDEQALESLLAFMGIAYDSAMFEALQTPQNVFFPMDFQLTDHQLQQFDAICTPMMTRLGYAGTETYTVSY